MNYSKAFTSFSTSDIQKSLSFYKDILELDATLDTQMQIIKILLKNGEEIMIYPKEDHNAATYTVLNFQVEDIRKIVKELKNKGVVFESYSEAIQTDEDNISSGYGHHMAWFKDNAGNIVSLIQEDK
jgi:catechol 2,3-dioxygenase-like lactoylglutathione lyase family enzyme